MKFKNLSSENTLRYNKSATCFNDALPVGNGRIGAVIYGGVEEEKFSLNEDTLWSGYPMDNTMDDYPAVLKKAKQIFESGEKLKAQRLLESSFGDRLNQVYLPLADIKIYQKHSSKASRYLRKLSLDTAVHTVSYTADGCRYIRESFVSEPAQILAVRYLCDKKAGISFKAVLEGRLKCSCENCGEAVMLCGTAPVCKADFGDMYRSEEYQIYDGKGIGYAALMSVKAQGGSVTYNGNEISVENADEAVIYFSARTNFKRFDVMPQGEEHKQKCISDIEDAKDIPFEKLKKQSIASHKRLYNRSGISLGTNENARVATDERLRRLEKGKKDNALYALLFNFGKYLTIAGSRTGTQPTNLQGIWNDKIIPPWSSNYTTNINTEMNYWPTLKCGLFECYEPLIRMVEELSRSGEVTAKLFYGEEGWTSHHNSDLWRLTHPATGRLNNSAQWGFWCMASGWLSVMAWDYYRYTLDKEYLKRIYPVIEGSARFYREMLTESDGGLILSPSTSPENNYIENGETIAIDKSTAMSQEIIADLFTAVGKAQQILGIADEYSEIVPKLKWVSICKNGELCEWHNEHEVWDVHHRHVSHLYGLFPAMLFDEKEREAAKRVLLSRGDSGTGWSLAWKINLWARLGDGEHALRLLNNQLKVVPAQCDGIEMNYAGGSYPNLLCAHPPFQIDGNFGAASGIIEMLVQYDKENNPVLLPALPKEWKNGFVKNIRIPGGKQISFAWENGKIIEKTIKTV